MDLPTEIIRPTNPFATKPTPDDTGQTPCKDMSRSAALLVIIALTILVILVGLLAFMLGVLMWWRYRKDRDKHRKPTGRYVSHDGEYRRAQTEQEISDYMLHRGRFEIVQRRRQDSMGVRHLDPDHSLSQNSSLKPEDSLSHRHEDFGREHRWSEEPVDLSRQSITPSEF